jgi:hypothetical protein
MTLAERDAVWTCWTEEVHKKNPSDKIPLTKQQRNVFFGGSYMYSGARVGVTDNAIKSATSAMYFGNTDVNSQIREYLEEASLLFTKRIEGDPIAEYLIKSYNEKRLNRIDLIETFMKSNLYPFSSMWFESTSTNIGEVRIPVLFPMKK